MGVVSFGRYSLIELVGRGGMGEVWKAHDSATDRLVAVKVLNKQFVDDEVFQQRFHREARAAAGLNDPHVVPIHGYGEVDGRLYVEMRLIEGRGLDEVITRRGALPAHRAVHIVEQTASALEAAHRVGLVHRDVKPSNILVTSEDFAYLIDFGIARATGDVGLTQTGTAVGTWAYMAPERIRERAVDARSDVYALACVLHECLTGTRPFSGTTFEELAAAHLWVPPPRPSESNGTVPVELDAVIAEGMAKDLNERYSTVRALAAAARIALDPGRQATVQTRLTTPNQTEIPAIYETMVGDLEGEKVETASGPRSFAWPPADDPDRAPYRGWQPFEPVDAGIYFGRDAQIARALSTVQQMRADARKSWFVVLGPSGSGKSAFLRAGLIPRLQRDESEFFVLPIVRPDRDAIDGQSGFAQAIHAARQKFSLDGPMSGEIKSWCRDRPELVRGLLIELQRAVATRTSADGRHSSAPTLVLPVDQCEELLAADAGPQAEVLLRLLSDLTSPNEGNLHLIVAATIRSDRFEALQTRPEVADAEMELFGELKPMPREQFREVILGPATAPADVKQQVALTADLVDRLLEDCREGADTLPLLSLTLARLYEDYGSSKVLTLEQYEQMGGLQRVVRSEIDHVLARDETQRREQLAVLRATFIPWLATVSADTDQPLRRVARYRDLPQASHALVDAMVARRLLVKDLRDGETVVEVALESLLRQWDELDGWLRDERIHLKTADDIERLTATWEFNRRDPSWLLTGSRLVEAEALAGAPGFAERLAKTREFINNSRQAENYRLYEQEQRRNAELWNARERQAIAEAHAATLRKRSRVLRAVLAVTAVIAVVAVVLGFVFVNQRQTALAERNAAIALRLNTEARAIMTGDRPGGDITAFQELLAARAIAPPDDGALVRAIAERTQTVRVVDARSSLFNVALSSNGDLIAAPGNDEIVRVWNAETGQPVGEMTAGTDCLGVAFSPDARLLAAACNDEVIRVWNIETGELAGEPLTGHADSVIDVAFSPDGTRLASAGNDDTALLWDTGTWQPVGAPLIGHTDDIESVSFSPDGRRLATASDDYTVRLWDVDTGQPIGAPLTGHFSEVFDVVFSPDGDRLATGSRDMNVRLWDADTGAPIGEPLSGHNNSVMAVAFSPDGRRLASGCYDGTAQFWDVEAGAAIGPPLDSHRESVTGVAFTSDGQRLITASNDETVRVWHTGDPLIGHTDEVMSLAISPDGYTLASGSRDNTIRLWDTDTGLPVGDPFVGHRDTVSDVVFSPDGTQLASAGYDDTVRLWDVATGQPVGAPFRGHTAPVNGVAFSPDGQVVASASDDGTVRLWDPDTGDQLLKSLSYDYPIWCLTFSPDGNFLAAGGDEFVVYLWNFDSGDVDLLDGHENTIRGLAFSSDGEKLASASVDSTVQLWDVNALTPIGQPLTGHSDGVHGVAFSPGRDEIATASQDYTVRLWNAETGQPASDPLAGHTGWVYDVAYTPDGRRLATASEDATVRLWDIAADPQTLCDKLSENMSHRQWEELVSPDLPYVTTCPDLPVPPD